MALKIALTTLGCKVNQFETAVMQEQLLRQGFKAVPFDQPADVYVINTCTVTNRSDLQSRQLIRQASRRNASAYIVVTGCYAQTNYQRIQRISGVDLILGNAEKLHIARYLTKLEKTSPPKTIVGRLNEDRPLPRISGFLDYTRAFVKIQDGCNHACSYCIVPQARGVSRSQPPELIQHQLERLIDAGYKEIVLTGVHIGTYGQDLHPPLTLAGLLSKLIELKGLGRLRLSSIEPTEFSTELIEILQSEKICPHLHIPLQSAHEEQLKLMRRHYSPAQYQELIDRLVNDIPHLALGCDIIVGFPGETESIFEHNYQFIAQLPVAYLHVFRYSPRPQTPAASFPGQVDGEAKIARSQRLRALSRQKHQQYQQRYLGEVRPTLILNQRDEETGRLSSLTDNYLKLLVPPDKRWINQLLPVRISRIEHGRILGEVVTHTRNLS
jgi:threonylcarbamoyladenosine tRNA methylthiotransferase MtaB